MEATVLSIGKSVVNGALSYAKSAVAKEVALQLGVHSDQAFITDELEMMQAFLAAAHDERDDHKVVKTWVKQVRDVAYDVEDSLQDFAVRIENYSWWRIRAVLDRRRIANEMKDLRVKVEDVSQRNVRYRLIRGSASKPTSNDEQSIISTEVQLQIAEATRAALQDKNKVDLVKLITQDEDVPSAIAVWGASSDVGVASIIRAAYDNQDVKAKFECRAWMRLTHPFNPNDFFASLVRQFYGEPCKDSVKKTGVEVFKQMEAQDNLVDEFNRFVTEKRYLVVINDVSTIEEWDWIKTYFPNNKGSQIIVSTQQFEVASLCTEQPYMVSEIEQKWSFDKEFFAFYKKVDAGTQEESKSGSSSTEPEKLTPAIAMAAALVEDELIDRVEAKAKLLELLCQGGEVIAIYGMGGLGKTTLVRSVYQEHGDRFQRRAWLTVSRSFTEKEFIGELLQQLLRNNEDKGGSGSDKEANATLQKKKEKEPIVQLAEILLEHKCLIVFDDLWSVEKWKWIMKLLPPPRNEGRNRIIVTTRELNIAEHCSSGKENIYNLDLLNEEDARELFKKKVFKGNTEKDDCSHNLDMIEQENHILKKCGGLPLAISSIGSFLASKPKTATEWRNLNKHISAELEINPELGMIKTVLTSSYEGLQYHLKPCFLYLSIFSEDQDIRWKRLVRRWIAEGYSRGRRGMTAEEIGTGYITELIDRTMVQPSKGATRRIGRSVFLQVHDLIREIGISKAAEENLVTTLEGSCNVNTEGKIRHLAVSSSWRRDRDAFESGLDLSHLRSLTVFGAWQSFFISDKMRFLRVLDLEDTVGITDHDLHQICQLFLLSYLSLRRCDGILRLPNSLGNLKFLQTLDIRDTEIINLPRTIVKLRKMQYLRVGFVPKHEEERKTNCISAIMAHGSFCVSCCYNVFRYLIRLLVRPCYRFSDSQECFDFSMQLVRLLLGCIYFVVWCVVWLLLFMGFGPLLLLVCCSWVVMTDGFAGLPLFFFGLNPRGVKLPRGIRQLKALHTLGVVNIDGANAILEDLCYLTELRKLRVTGLNKSNCVRFFRAISGNDCLESLLVWSNGDPGLAGCFDEVSSAPKNLQKLKLYGNLVKLPEWIKGLQNLGKLELRSTMISEHDKAIKCLGELPKLINLHLLKKSFSNERVSFSFHHGAFPSLRVLEMSLWYVTPTIWSSASTFRYWIGCGYSLIVTTESTNPGNLERVKFEDGAAPKLEVLLFSGNPSETDVGLFSGLKYLTSLKELMLHNNNYKDAFLEDLGKQLAENTISVPILKRYDYDYHQTGRDQWRS